MHATTALEKQRQVDIRGFLASSLSQWETVSRWTASEVHPWLPTHEHTYLYTRDPSQGGGGQAKNRNEERGNKKGREVWSETDAREVGVGVGVGRAQRRTERGQEKPRGDGQSERHRSGTEWTGKRREAELQERWALPAA